MLATFLAKRGGGRGGMLLYLLLRYRFFLDFAVSEPSLDPIFFRFSKFGAPFLMRCRLYFVDALIDILDKNMPHIYIYIYIYIYVYIYIF